MQQNTEANSPPQRVLLSVVLVLVSFMFMACALAEDTGARTHAKGNYDATTSTYTVAKGDDLGDIAKRFGLSVATLQDRNQLDSDTIQVGQTLRIATGSAETGTAGTGNTDAGSSEYHIISGEAGSPAAKASIAGDQLPPPPAPFQGEIKHDALKSTPWWSPTVVPPKDAPNILLVLTDDSGFAVPSTFGGVIPTPSMDRIANEGLRYNRMMSTSLCSPTRSALITGRNHHSVGFGVIAEQATGYPGYDSVIGVDNATIGRILRDNGYATSWFGKDHNTPTYQASQAGPFTQWPTGMGFDYFYGFVGGDANQWQPNLFRNTTQIYPWVGHEGDLKMDRSDPKAEIWPVTGEEASWNLITAMADDAIDWMTRIHQTNPDQPIFIKYAPGSQHAPHHPTKEWVDKIHAMHLFDDGYEKLRERIFENQKQLGVIPEDEELTPWPKDILKPWDELTDEEKKLFIRQVEVFAAYVAYNDHEIGRVIQAFEDLGKLDNTLVIYINGDNGTSAEGGPDGTFSEVAFFNGVRPPVDVQMKYYDAWGTEFAYNHMSAGWSWAFDTPFDWFKQNASRLGGVNQTMVVSWPKGIKDKGALRQQFMHVIDVVPTLLEVTGIPAPEVVDGIKQKPIEGTSFAYTFDAENAEAPSRHKTQYFEMMGQWALYHDGWLLSTKVDRAPWDAFGPANPDPLNNQVLQLYHLSENFNQSENIADKHPDKVKELRELFIAEAEKYQVFPLDASVAARVAAPRPSLTAGLTELTYTRPMTGIPQGDAPFLLNTSYTITADITVPEGGAEGMIATSGGRFAGWGFYLLDGKPVFNWNLLNLEWVKWQGAEALTPGKHSIEFDFAYDGMGLGTLTYNSFDGVGKGGTGTLKVDGKVVDTQRMEKTLPMILQWDESFDIGSDTLTGIDDSDYLPPFPLTAELDTLTIKINRPQLSPKDIAKLEEAMKKAEMGIQ
ncbi:sulfatase-like hydrolase/transferase [Rhabdochromatium marinum]|uniref:sulfatase-like hydrolase/transferase n=1 Tax=Rhabdochromatium marinum TaxID=48729 RepID=UPI0019063B49|nr:sulfatase-like hydrolase/transferase [Rhabdochromatium marinum]MBK1648763.1 arylsulfatase [Rhabdochromatium marinum]